MKAYWDQRKETDEFRKNVKELYHGIIKDTLDQPFEWYLDYGSHLLKKPAFPENWYTTGENARREWQPLIREELRKKNKALKEIMQEETIDSIKTHISHPANWDRETVEAVVKQNAVKDLLVTIINDAIISFNKKFNPFFGAVAALGLDKQIKEFIIPFMDSATDIATNFIIDPANSTKFSEMSKQIVDIIVRQKPEVLLKFTKIPNDDDYAAMVKAAMRDEKTLGFISEVYDEVSKKMKERKAGKTLGEVLKEHGFDGKWPDIDDTDLDFIIRWMNNSPALLKFFDQEAKVYKP